MKPNAAPLGLVLGLITALPCLAGGPIVLAEDQPPAVAPTTPDWQGAYVGLSIGKPTGDNVFGRSDLDIWSSPADWSGSPTSVTAGYDWQRGRLVYGVALDLTFGDISNPTEPSDVVICFVDCEIAVSGLKVLRGRIGVTSGRNLFYATAGLARADARFTALAGVAVIGEGSLDGWTAGIGIERRMGDHITLTGEYRHTDLGVLPLNCFETCQTAISFGTAQIGITYRW
jgi:outer membrane immunogenic protein